jgi:RNA polymerase sigma-70 factor (ECF subfamily)
MVDDGTTNEWRGSAAPCSASSSLLERVKARDQEAWRRLIDLYSPLIYGWCRQCGLQAEDAADIGQEVFSAVAVSQEGFRRDVPGASFRGWLWTITRNKVRDFFRRQKAKARAEGGDEAQQWLAQVPEHEPESTASGPACDNRIELQAVELARCGVEERTWQAFWLVTVEDKAPAVVAEALGITAQAVYGAIYRVRRRIRQELEGLID